MASATRSFNIPALKMETHRPPELFCMGRATPQRRGPTHLKSKNWRFRAQLPNNSSFCNTQTMAANNSDYNPETGFYTINNMVMHDLVHRVYCSKCDTQIHGSVTTAQGKKFHANCFTCHYCGQPIYGPFHEKVLKNVFLHYDLGRQGVLQT